MGTSKITPAMLVRTKQIIGGVITRLRKELGLTQAELADRAGCTQSWISKIEAGKAKLDFESLIYVSWALEVPLTELFTNNPDTIQWQKAQTLVYAMATGRAPPEEARGAHPGTRSTDSLAAPELLAQTRRLRDDARMADAAELLAHHLPDAIRNVRVPGALGTLSHILQVAATCLVHLGELPGAWLAAQGAILTAEHANTKAVAAKLTAAGIHRRSGRLEVAASLAHDVLTTVGAELRTPTVEATAAHGIALLELAAHAAKQHNTTDVASYLSRARRTAEQFEHDLQLEGVRFGPFEYALRELDASIRLSDKRRSLRLAQQLDLTQQPPLHQVRGLAHIARAYLRAAERDEACDTIIQAIRVGPQLSSDPIIRSLIDELSREFTHFERKIHQLQTHIDRTIPKPRRQF